MFDECVDFAGHAIGVQQSGGTSESAPLTAGVAALVIQAYRNTHGGAFRHRRWSSRSSRAPPTTSVPRPTSRAPACVDAYKAVLAAESYKAPASAPKAAQHAADQRRPVQRGRPAGTPETFTDTVTNNGAKPQTVSVSTRTLGAYRRSSAR